MRCDRASGTGTRSRRAPARARRLALRRALPGGVQAHGRACRLRVDARTWRSGLGGAWGSGSGRDGAGTGAAETEKGFERGEADGGSARRVLDQCELSEVLAVRAGGQQMVRWPDDDVHGPCAVHAPHLCAPVHPVWNARSVCRTASAPITASAAAAMQPCCQYAICFHACACLCAFPAPALVARCTAPYCM
jgi:hypothetical protein